MTDKQQTPVTVEEEKVTIGCYISLALAITFFSGALAGTAHFYSFLDFQTLMGSAGKLVTNVSEAADGTIVTKMGTFRGTGGSGALDAFVMGISMVLPGVMLAIGMITVFEHYGALKAAKKLLTPVLRFLIGVPGTATLAMVACLQSTDGGAALTRQLKDSGALTEREVNIFAAFQMTGCAPVTNFITFSALVFALQNADGSPALPITMGTGLAVLLGSKFVGANLMRVLLALADKRQSAKDAKEAQAAVPAVATVTIERN